MSIFNKNRQGLIDNIPTFKTPKKSPLRIVIIVAVVFILVLIVGFINIGLP